MVGFPTIFCSGVLASRVYGPPRPYLHGRENDICEVCSGRTSVCLFVGTTCTFGLGFFWGLISVLPVLPLFSSTDIPRVSLARDADARSLFSFRGFSSCFESDAFAWLGVLWARRARRGG